jgi:GDSL-like Lipase/Acylhydrolase family
MALITKTDPKGVDFVINAIQNYIYLNLIGAGWDVYECYPRANKNFKNEFVIPEISTDPENYKPVLFDDTKKATSFFLVDDKVLFNEEEQLIVQNVSIVFQVNLKELYPAITDHRSDEELHVLITSLLTDNQDLFVDVLGYDVGIRNVYSDLNISGINTDTERNDDLGKFHVVKYNFTVTYDLEDCDITFSPTCSPASILINGVNFVVVSSGASEDIQVVDTTDAQVGAPGVGAQLGKWVVPASGGGVTPPTAGLMTPLSWVGINVVEYIYDVPSDAANNLNTFKRDAGPQSFNMNIFSEQSMLGTDDFVVFGDNDYNASFSQFWGIGVESDTGVNFADIDFCFFIAGSSIIWFESGVNLGTKATLNSGEFWWWRLDYDGSTKDLKLYIDGVLVYTAATGYLAQPLVVKHNGRNANHISSRHIGLIKGSAPTNLMASAGDSLTFGRSITGFPGHSHVAKGANYSNNKFLISPVIAIPGSTTQDIINDQVPLFAKLFSPAYTKKVLQLMAGINDWGSGVPLATWQANILTIVAAVQNEGGEVMIHTVLRDFGQADFPNRSIGNDWILNGNSGAEYIVDHTNSVMETNKDYFEGDLIHPNNNGMTQIAFETYNIILSI